MKRSPYLADRTRCDMYITSEHITANSANQRRINLFKYMCLLCNSILWQSDTIWPKQGCDLILEVDRSQPLWPNSRAPILLQCTPSKSRNKKCNCPLRPKHELWYVDWQRNISQPLWSQGQQRNESEAAPQKSILTWKLPEKAAQLTSCRLWTSREITLPGNSTDREQSSHLFKYSQIFNESALRAIPIE